MGQQGEKSGTALGRPPNSGNLFECVSPNDTKQGAELESRLLDRGISIGIDRASGGAWLLFKPSDVEAVRHVANILHEPFRVSLTPAQRQELFDSLNYFEAIQARQKAQVKP